MAGVNGPAQNKIIALTPPHHQGFIKIANIVHIIIGVQKISSPRQTPIIISLGSCVISFNCSLIFLTNCNIFSFIIIKTGKGKPCISRPGVSPQTSDGTSSVALPSTGFGWKIHGAHPYINQSNITCRWVLTTP